MKYASFYRNNKPPFEIDEYNLYFDPEQNSYDKLISFCSKQERRINLLWDGEYDFDKLLTLNRVAKELVIRVTNLNLRQLPQLLEKKLDFFLDYTVPIHDFTMLEWVYQIKPKEIYVANDLIYNLKSVAEVCHDKGIRLRMVLNHIPLTERVGILSKTAPVFCPQDLPLLDLYIDTYEFDFAVTDAHFFREANLLEGWAEKEQIYYRIWFIDCSWSDDIKYLNKDVEYTYFCKYLSKSLNAARIGCRHRCTYIKSEYPCGMCERYVNKAIQKTRLEEEYAKD